MTTNRKTLIANAVAQNSARYGFAIPLEVFADLDAKEWDETNALAHIHEAFEREAEFRVRDQE